MRLLFFPRLLIIMAGLMTCGNQMIATTAGKSSRGADADLKIRIRNVAGGNPAVPGARGTVILFNDQYTFKAKTKDGLAVLENIPSAFNYTMQVTVDSDSEAYQEPVEFWGAVHDLEVGYGTQHLEFERSMPYITHLEVLNGERFAAFSAVEAGKPLIIRMLVMNPSPREVNLEALLKLHPVEADSALLLQQPVCAAAGETTEVLLSFTPSQAGSYLAAPALKILNTLNRYTDCWDWSGNPLFTVVKNHRVLEFAGFRWHVKAGFGPPGPNMWSDHYEHVWVDENQELHLTLTPAGKQWLATEVISDDYFGYGTYTFFLKTDPTTLDPHAVAALFLYRDGNNEIDIEFTRWGNPENDNVGNYVLQPANVPGNQYVFPLKLQGAYSTHRIIWQPHKVVFESWHGHYMQPEPSILISRWEYAGEHVPRDHQVRLHFNFWLFRGFHPRGALQQHFVISGFSYSEMDEKKNQEDL